ncbi:MAG: hypothetical protein H6741_02775 [Alphaproteobacteria bacterium]|nr:hypothetical protein [Alphaproteobacteria bacterium]MCB9791627.1 hypothetical protein [Alphaproteobacteria bacterium]
MIVTCLLAAAWAQEPNVGTNVLPLLQDPAATTPTEAPSGLSSPTEPEKARDYLMEVNLRGRYLALPDSILDIWYYNGDDDGGNHLPRPKARGYSAGIEYVVRNDTQAGVFYFDYMGNLMEGGYWDDAEPNGEEPNYLDGEYIVPNRFALLAGGANYYYTLNATPWLGFVFGAGLGVTYIMGDLDSWTADDGEPAYVRFERGDPPDTIVRVPGVLPILDINAGVKFNINNRASIRLEGGFHDLFYGGAAMGVTF